MLPSDVAMVIAHVALLIVGFWRAGLKTHELLEEGEFHIACRAISIFGNNKFCLALVSIALVVGVVALRCSIITVSYTHLRAHETVLDLVCRLLLEKKK